MPNLIFQTLTIYNFGSYIDGPHTINFADQGCLVYITGINKEEPSLGSNNIGKSTLLNALYWVLTGRVLRSSRPGQIIEPWDNTDTVSVALEFKKNDTPHYIKRTRRPNSLELDDAVVSQDQVYITLGLPERAIDHTIIIGQFSDLFLDRRPEEQSQLFTELLNLLLWIKCADLSNKKAKQVEADLAEVERQINHAEGRLISLTEQEEATKLKSDEFEKNKVIDLVVLQEGLASEKESLSNIEEALHNAKLKLQELPDISVQEEQLKGFRKQEITLLEAISTSKTIKARHERELKEVENRLLEYQKADNTCPACGQPVDQDHIDEMIAGFEVRRRKLIETVAASAQILLKREKNLKEVRDGINGLETGVAQTREEAKERDSVYNEILFRSKQKQQRIDQLSSEIDTLVSTRNPHGAILSDISDRLVRIRHDIRACVVARDTCQQTLEQLHLWVDGFKEIRLNLIDETLEELEIVVNKHAIRHGLTNWEIGFHTERETAKGNVIHKFTVNIFPPNIDYPIPFESLGGGVSTRIQLAIHFGLSEVLLARAGITPNIEILDEPSRHLSEEGIEDLLESLKERAQETGRAIYFIDHRMLDHGLFDDVIFIDKDETGSRIVEAS